MSKRKKQEFGGMNPWEKISSNDLQQIYPNFQGQYVQINQPSVDNFTQVSPEPSGKMELNPKSPTNSGKTNNKKSNAGKIGSALGAIGSAAGQALQQSITGGLSLANTLIPQQQQRLNTYVPTAYNPLSMGTGSQALFKNGGEVSNRSVFRDDISDEEAMYYYMNNIPLPERKQSKSSVTLPDVEITSKRSKKRGIEVVEDIDYMQPSQQEPLSVTPFSFKASVKKIPSTEAPKRKEISYIPSYDALGNLTEYRPEFKNYDMYSAMQDIKTLPDNFNNIPVNKSADTYGEEFQNFYPTTQNWTPFSDKNYKPYTVPKFKNGGFVEGGEYDLDPETIQNLINQGYQIEF